MPVDPYSQNNYTGPTGGSGTNPNNDPYYQAPPPPAAPPQYYAPPGQAPRTPNAGDVNPENGNRWMPGVGWQPENMFSDLNPGYGGQSQPGQQNFFNNVAGYSIPPTIQAQMGGLTPGGAPYIPPGPNSGTFYEMQDQALSYLPPGAREWMSNYLRGQGYTGTGNLGQYGERSWVRPGGSGAFDFGQQDVSAIGDPQVQQWIRWYLGERGLPGFGRQTYPGQAATP